MPPVLRFFLITVGIIAVTLGVTIIAGAQMGLFSGKPPADLGWRDGKFRAPDWRPNWVSSLADAKDAQHHVAPLAVGGDGKRAWAELREVVKAMPRANIVTDKDGYMHVEFASARMGFIDDAEFALDEKAGVIQVLSGARLGVRDFNVNRDRVEEIRADLAARLAARK